MIFLASIQESLSVMVGGFVLDCLTAVAGGLEFVGGGMEGSKEKSSRMETTKLTSGWARGTKVGVEDFVDETDWMSRAG